MDSGGRVAFIFCDKGVQEVMKRCSLEGFEHVCTEVKGHEFCEAEGDRNVMLQGIQKGPKVLAFHLLV